VLENLYIYKTYDKPVLAKITFKSGDTRAVQLSKYIDPDSYYMEIVIYSLKI